MHDSSINARPLGENILVDIYDDGEETVEFSKGLNFVLLDDSKFGLKRDNPHETHPGIRPRWAKVLAVTDYAIKNGVSLGDKVLLDTMKWSRGLPLPDEENKRVWRIPVKDVLMVDDDGFSQQEKDRMESRNNTV